MQNTTTVDKVVGIGPSSCIPCSSAYHEHKIQSKPTASFSKKKRKKKS